MTETDFGTIYNTVTGKLKNLAPSLTYHAMEHTLDVLNHVERIGLDEGIDSTELFLLKVAALYHDTGFLYTYKGHEEKGCELFIADNEQFHFSAADQKIITDLIMATKVPQQPHTRLQQIICDADLDYLGRNDFYEIGKKLKTEFFNYSIVKNEAEWHQLQLTFLGHHHYHTDSSKRLREPVKNIHLKEISR